MAESNLSAPGSANNQSQIDLPIEILIYIMEYLPLSDRIIASQVCRAWYEASQDQKLHKEEIVVLQENITRQLGCLLNSTTSFQNFYFRDVELDSKLIPFWEKYCPKMRYLYLESCVVTERMFVEILSSCCHLENLMINDCHELMMTGRVLELELDVLKLRKALVNLKGLSITHNRYMSDAIFYRFVSTAPNLHELDLTGCQISYHMGLYKKFYPPHVVDESNLVLSETVFTFNVILKFIREQAQKIKVLKLGQTLVDNSALSQLGSVHGLNLKAIYLESCNQLTNIGLTNLVSVQKSLTCLDLSGCSRLTDHALIAICHNLVNLTSLSIQSCRAVTDIGVAELARLEKLKCINLAQCEMVTGQGVTSGLCQKINRQMQNLHLGALQMDEESVCKIATNLPCLRHLDLSWCFSAVTDRSMQVICEYLLSLNTLELASCNKISDAGITGMTANETISDSALEASSAFEEYPDPLHKINLRSRAEKEIVNDAKRKQAVLHKITYNDESQGMCLVRIQGLQKIDLSGCNRVTDVGLLYAFNFPALQYLDLSRCQQITAIGLAALSENNPSLETLVMNSCFNITDTGILSVVKGLKRLKHLDIQGCRQLTDASLIAIGQHCQCLLYLNVNSCIEMTVGTVLEMEKKLETLRTLYYVGLKTESSIGENFGCSPAPPPPPRKKHSAR
ncbi:hypothetical protein R5R35_002172 [Gryllus longicercus]|uniref:F-box domain-containing protein n=1 Tax=Gryllus longicercus TaxID=2509291 RepID=A0AAN9Z297_9ORTH